MDILTAKQKEEIVALMLERDESFFDLLIPYTTPEWADFDDQERLCYSSGFVTGFMACVELKKHYIKRWSKQL